jgi:hypothetical protein
VLSDHVHTDGYPRFIVRSRELCCRLHRMRQRQERGQPPAGPFKRNVATALCSAFRCEMAEFRMKEARERPKCLPRRRTAGTRPNHDLLHQR